MVRGKRNSRLQRWAVSRLQRGNVLSVCNYTLKYKTETSNSNVDCLRRFSKDCENDFSKLENYVFLTSSRITYNFFRHEKSISQRPSY